jgi:NAD(P)-dependent dehydrogenase (short-subunit alcohol dehydrogenase family)
MYGLVKDKITLVTGAAQGIGKAVAMIYAENGATVVLCDLNEEKVKEAAREITTQSGQKCIGMKMDISSSKDIDAAVSETLKEFDRIDVLCNSAGILMHSLVVDMQEDQWDKIFEINMKGAFLITKAVAKVMIKQKSGKIVHISSCSGKKPTREEAAYCSTKSALNGFVKVCALELGEYGINVNAVCPGATDTEMVRKNFITSREIEQEWINKTALKKLGTVEDQAKAVLFLSSTLADHITGEAIIVSAGEMMTQ